MAIIKPKSKSEIQKSFATGLLTPMARAAFKIYGPQMKALAVKVLQRSLGKDSILTKLQIKLNKAKSLEKLGKLKNLTKEQKLEMNKFLPKLKEYKKKLFKQAKKHKETLKEKSPWRISKFKGGLIDKTLTGRSRDI